MKKRPKNKPVRKKPSKRRPRKPAAKRPRKKPQKPGAKPKPKPKPKSKRKRRRTIVLFPVTGPNGRPVLRRSKKDQVRWWNKDTVAHTIQFGIWIFKEKPAAPIPVSPGAKSDWYTIDPAVALGVYSYAILPAFAAQGPPDPPEIECDS